MASHMKQVKKCKHHQQAELCVTRAKYRQGRKLTAVKVYTINQESKYLLIQGVSSVGAKNELENMCSEYGVIDELNVLDDYPSEEYTEAYCVKYKEIHNARFAKRKLDDRSFFGGTLHVCYAPEFETMTDTREKLNERRKIIAAKTKIVKKYIYFFTFSNDFPTNPFQRI
uniref:RNA-binding protein 48 n=1 Tax=Strigamia maritima TaxID=126957 RepID=T1JII2_STRMM